MKFVATIRWLLRTAFLLVVGLLLLRAVLEYIPALQAAPLFRALVRSWDPVLSDLVESTGLPWSREVRGLLLPGVAVALILLRTLIEDVLERASAPPKPARAPAEATQGGPVATMIRPAATTTDTAFRPTATLA